MRRLLILAASIIALAGCDAAASARPLTLTVITDSATAPLAESLLNTYEAAHPNSTLSLDIRPRAAAAESVEEGSAALLMQPTYDQTTFSTTIAHEMLLVIAHPETAVNSLTEAELRGILSGAITDWAEVGGQQLPIQVIIPAEGRSTREALGFALLEGQDVTSAALLSFTTADTLETVSTTPGSISLVPRSALADAPVAVLAINGAEPTVQLATRRRYPLVIPVVFIAEAEPEGDARRFLEWILSAEGQAAARRVMLGYQD